MASLFLSSSPHEPLYTEAGGVILSWSKRAEQGGAVGIRANSVRDIINVRKWPSCRSLGLSNATTHRKNPLSRLPWKKSMSWQLWISRLLRFDCTKRSRRWLVTLSIKSKRNISSTLDGWYLYLKKDWQLSKREWTCRNDPLSGYTTTVQRFDGPDFKLIHRLCQAGVDVIAEGKDPLPGSGQENPWSRGSWYRCRWCHYSTKRDYSAFVRSLKMRKTKQ